LELVRSQEEMEIDEESYLDCLLEWDNLEETPGAESSFLLGKLALTWQRDWKMSVMRIK
jgi:hypothetical protein